MRAQRVFRPNRKTPEERARQQGLREKLKAEKASQQSMAAGTPAGGKLTDFHVDLEGALRALKAEREQAGLSIADVAKRSGLDRAVVSQLESGKPDNPTVATLTRYAAAIGKRFVWSYDDLTPKVI